MLANSDGTKGHINKAWRDFTICVRNPISLDEYKCTMSDSHMRDIWAKMVQHKEDPRLLKHNKDLGSSVRTRGPMKKERKKEIPYKEGILKGIGSSEGLQSYNGEVGVYGVGDLTRRELPA